MTPRLSRRTFIAGAAVTATGLSLSACASDEMDEYGKVNIELRASLPENPNLAALIRFATLAPSGHNTQPWHFSIRKNGLSILPDLSRRTPVVDPDDHHLFVSLGCATENLLIAAGANGYPAAMVFDDRRGGRVEIDFARGPRQADALYGAIPLRQSTRSVYDGRSISARDIKLLEAACTTPGVSVSIMTDAKKRENVLNFLIQGNKSQMSDPAFVSELRDWIRFNPSQALTARDGLFTGCTGNPTVPTWLGKRMFSRLLNLNTENAKYAAQTRSSAGVAVFFGEKADPEHWVKVGRSFQRFALQATALGIRHALINQPVEVPSVRGEFAKWLGIGAVRPDLVVRFGTARTLPMSLRRPVEHVIAPEE